MWKHVALLVALTLGGCFESPVSNSTNNTYMVVLYRNDKTVESNGTLRFDKIIDDKVNGFWYFDSIAGDGKFEGTIVGREYFLNLHPGWADHNLYLRGTFQNAAFTGTWEFVGIAGPMEQGTFEGTPSPRRPIVENAN